MGKRSSFHQGISAGLPIGLGYLSGAFAFGVFAASNGFTVWDALLISASNLTSAGQLAAVPLIKGGSLIELAFTELIINPRYALMSLTLSQKFDRSVRLPDRFSIAFFNTDEVFAIALSYPGKLNRYYMWALGMIPFFSWTAGTLLGALAGTFFSPLLVSALGLAVYSMIVAVCVPAARKSKKVFFCILLAVALRCLFYYTPYLNRISPGFAVTICAVISSVVFARIDCIFEKEAKQ